MTQAEIIEMARQAGMYQDLNVSFNQSIQNFAKLVAAKAFQDGYEKGIAAFNEAVNLEREACAKVCGEIYRVWVCEGDEAVDYPDPHDCMRAIRARGEAA